MKPTLKTIEPRNQCWEWAEPLGNGVGNRHRCVFYCAGEHLGTPRGPRSVRALHHDAVVTRETHASAFVMTQPKSSLDSECSAIGAWESEASIVAAKSGNADGAKGRRFKITKHSTMDRTQSRTAP